MQVLPRCGHCVHEDAPDKVTLGSSDCERICFLFGFVACSKICILKPNSFFSCQSCRSWVGNSLNVTGICCCLLQVAEVLTSYLVRLKLAAAKENFQRWGVCLATLRNKIGNVLQVICCTFNYLYKPSSSHNDLILFSQTNASMLVWCYPQGKEEQAWFLVVTVSCMKKNVNKLK